MKKNKISLALLSNMIKPKLLIPTMMQGSQTVGSGRALITSIMTRNSSKNRYSGMKSQTSLCGS
jgi:hypothetical protein